VIVSARDRTDDPRDGFFGEAAHQLRTPLTPLLMLAHLLEEDATLPPHLRPQVAMMRENVEMASRLIDELADLGRFRTGQLTIEPIDHDLAQLLSTVLESRAPEAQLKRVVLHTTLEATALPVVIDAARVQRVIDTLVSNAIVQSSRDQTVLIALHRLPGAVQLSVHDHGRGWSHDCAAAVFELLPSDRPPGSGSRFGIGLALGRRITELHGGRLEAHSDGPGRGAVFTLTLPTLRR
jgi:two-component system CheB/CheR fusion protein